MCIEGHSEHQNGDCALVVAQKLTQFALIPDSGTTYPQVANPKRAVRNNSRQQWGQRQRQEKPRRKPLTQVQNLSFDGVHSSQTLCLEVDHPRARLRGRDEEWRVEVQGPHFISNFWIQASALCVGSSSLDTKPKPTKITDTFRLSAMYLSRCKGGGGGGGVNYDFVCK